MSVNDKISGAIIAAAGADYATGWVDWIPEQNLQNIMYELSIFWLSIQIIIKIHDWWTKPKDKL